MTSWAASFRILANMRVLRIRSGLRTRTLWTCGTRRHKLALNAGWDEALLALEDVNAPPSKRVVVKLEKLKRQRRRR